MIVVNGRALLPIEFPYVHKEFKFSNKTSKNQIYHEHESLVNLSDVFSSITFFFHLLEASCVYLFFDPLLHLSDINMLDQFGRPLYGINSK